MQLLIDLLHIPLLLLDHRKAQLHGIGKQQHQRNRHNGLSVCITVHAVGDDIADTTCTHHSKDCRGFKILFKADGSPGQDASDRGGKHCGKEDLDPTCPDGAQGLQCIGRNLLKALCKALGKERGAEDGDADDAGHRAKSHADQAQQYPDD